MPASPAALALPLSLSLFLDSNAFGALLFPCLCCAAAQENRGNPFGGLTVTPWAEPAGLSPDGAMVISPLKAPTGPSKPSSLVPFLHISSTYSSLPLVFGCSGVAC